MVWVQRETWRVGLALSCSLGIAFAGACSGSVETNPPEPGDAAAASGGTSGAGGTAGRGGTGGTTAGRGGSGGSAGSGGSFAGSGGTATGGASGSGVGGSGGNCQSLPDEDVCIQCARTNCCVELLTCGSDQSCMRGNEFSCILRCIAAAVNDGGVPDDATLASCASGCAVEGVIVASATSDLIGCLNTGTRADGGTGDDCFVECLAGD